MSNYAKVRRETAEKMREAPEVDRRSERDSAGRPIWCVAADCPCRASVYFGSALCSWHDVAPKHDWPAVTAELQATLAAGKTPVWPMLKRAAWVVEAAAKAKAAREGRADAGASLFAQAMPKVQRRPNRERIREYALELGIDVEDDEPQEATRAHRIAPGSIAAKEVA